MSKPGADVPQDEQVVVAGQTYNLRFSTKAWARLVLAWELHSVQEAQDRLNKIGDATKIVEIVDVFWAAMAKHHPEISREAADDIADDLGIERLATLLPRIIRNANPQTDAGQKKTAAPTRKR